MLPSSLPEELIMLATYLLCLHLNRLIHLMLELLIYATQSAAASFVIKMLLLPYLGIIQGDLVILKIYLVGMYVSKLA